MRDLFNFPDPVEETSARLVAAGVVAMAVSFLAVRSGWILVPLSYGFVARVATGPTLSPLGQFVTRVATPVLRRRGVTGRQVPGPPKRFAQGIGVAFTLGASLAWVAGAHGLALVLIGGLAVAAALEAFAGICFGCTIYRSLFGCAACDDISDRIAAALADR